jgi:hypothetical protein
MRKATGLFGIVACAAFLLAAPAGARTIGNRHGGSVAAARHRCDPIDPSLCLLPWPNDFFTRPDPSTATGRRLEIDPRATPRNAAGTPIDPTDWNRLDGFSPGSPIVTHVPGMDTPRAFDNTRPPTNTHIARSLHRDSPIVLIDANTGRRWPVWAELDRSVDLNGNPPSAAQTALIIHPAKNLAEGDRYIVALRNLRDAQGHVLAPQPAFGDLLHGHGKPSARERHYRRRILPQLRRAGVSRASLYLAWDFTVASRQGLTKTSLFMRKNALAALGDTTPGDGVVQGHAPKFVIDSCTVATGTPPAGCTTSNTLDPRVYAHVEGHVTVPCFLDQPGCPPGARFQYSSPDATVPTPIPGNTMQANFQCNIPIGAKNGRRFRPLLNGHGLFGSADQVNSDSLYALGKFGLMACATDEIGMSQQDIPNAARALHDLSSFPSIPDRLQQGLIDFLYLGRDLINPAGFCSSDIFRVNGRCVVNTSHLFYDGGSQGAIFGGALSAVDPDFTRSALNVAGMNYSLLLTRSSDFPEFAQILYPSYPDPLDRSLLYSFIQSLWDRGEMDGYAGHVTRDPLPGTPRHSVLMTIAVGDHQVTNWASEVEARTIGAHVRAPTVDPGRYPGPVPYWGIRRSHSFPFRGRAAMVVGDLGPLRPCPHDGVTPCEGAFAGTPPPPLDNNANTEGVDPHGPDWAQSPPGEAAIGHWLRPNGFLPSICNGHPCYMAGWHGP